jgi:hypothetical protein
MGRSFTQAKARELLLGFFVIFRLIPYPAAQAFLRPGEYSNNLNQSRRLK